MPSFNPHIARFGDYLRSERRYSPLTVRAYTDDLEQFVAYLGGPMGDFDPRSVQYSDIRSWIMYLADQKMAARSVNRKLSSLSRFYRYMLRTGLCTSDPTSRVRSLRQPRQLPNFVEQSRTDDLAPRLAEPTADFTTERDTLIILVLYATGLRLAELIGICLEDISYATAELKVLGKGDKHRIVPLLPIVLKKIENYLPLRAEIICKAEKNFLFLSNKGTKIARTSVYNIVNRTLAAAGVQGKRSPHVLRHTFATHLMNHGVEIRTIQELLGHESLSSTQIYTHNSIDKLKEVYHNAHPRAKKD